MTSGKAGSPKVRLYITCCFFLSGFCSLIYQAIWTRSLSLIFGHTTFAISTVITAFMGGLALGSWVIGRWADREGPLQKRLERCGSSPHFLMYGILEGLIGIYCLFTPQLFRIIESVYLHFSALPMFLIVALRFVLCLAVLIIPTFCMGGTLPLLSRFLIRSRSDIGELLGFLYFINTAGAVAGTVLSGFYLIFNVGITATLQSAAAINIGIALLVYVVNRNEGRLLSNSTEPDSGEQPQPAAPGVPHSKRSMWVLITVFTLTGFASMIYELAWTRALSLALGSSTYAFSAMLAAFLTGIALGSLIFSVAARRSSFTQASFGWLEILTGLSALLCIPLLGCLPFIFIRLFPLVRESYNAVIAVYFLLSFAVMLIPTTLMGVIFPLVGRLYTQSMDSLGRSIGSVYAVNTAGCIAGSALTGFVLIPLLGVQTSLKIAVAVNLLGGLIILYDCSRSKKALALCAAGTAAALALLAGLPPWNPAVMNSGAAIYTSQYQSLSSQLVSDPSNRPVFYRDGISATVAVLKVEDDYILRINGKTDASTGKKDMPTQLLLGYLPLVFNPDAKTAYVIGLGSGATARAVLDSPEISSVWCAELEPAVVEAQRYFVSCNDNVLSNSRFHLSLSDGRNGILASKERYDLIISEPSNPWISGIASLFTTEFYTCCRDHLSDRGVMLAWIHLYSMDPQDVKMVLRTFYSVFPYGSIWQSTPRNLLLLGSQTPLQLDYRRYQKLFTDNQAFRKGLESIGMVEPDMLLAHYIADVKGIEPLLSTSALNNDNLPTLEYSAPRSLYRDTTAENMEGLLSYKPSYVPPLKEGSGIQNLSPGFFVELSDLLSATNAKLYRNAVIRDGLKLYPDEARLHSACVESLIREGKPVEAIRYLHDLIRRDDGQYLYFSLLGRICEAQGQNEEALKAYGQALRLKQDDKNATIGYLRTAMACDRNEARSAMDRAMTAFPGDRDIIVLNAGMLMEEREFVKAAAMLEKVRRAGRDGREILDKLIICYEASGDSEKVIETCNTVLAKDPYCLNAALSCARALAARGRYEERRKVLLRCFKGNPYSRELIQCLMN